MSIPYEDTILIECDRKATSVKQESNKALWTNQLNESILMIPGDRVEVFNSFINDSGSGSEKPVEFRGSDLKKSHKIKSTQPYSAVAGGQTYRTHILNTRDFYTAYEAYITVDEDIQLKDNEAKTTINYYKTMDGMSYVQLPRRFYPSSKTFATGTTIQKIWGEQDQILTGRTNRERASTVISTGVADTSDEKVYGYVVEDLKSMRNYQRGGALTLDGAIQYWISKNDNTKYTIFRRRFNCNPLNENVPALFPVRGAGPAGLPNYDAFFPPYYARDPEYFNYDIYRETLTLSVDTGFSAAKNIAEEITQQMRETEILPTERRLHQIELEQLGPARPPGPKLWYDLNQRVQSKTYKTFAACNETTMSEQFYARAIFNGTDLTTITAPVDASGNPGVNIFSNAGFYEVTPATDREAARYYQGYESIAIKRPELYETGTKLNDIFGFQLAQDHLQVNNKIKPIVIDVPYYDIPSLANGVFVPSIQLTRMRDFFKAQANYPELFSEENVINMYNFQGAGQNPYWTATTGEVFVTKDNARFLHFNAAVSTGAFGDIGININSNLISEDVGRYDIAGQPKPEFTQLGNSYYDYRGTCAAVAGAPAPVSFNRTLSERTQSDPFYTHYVLADSDTFYDIPNDANDSNPNRFTFGFAGAQGQTADTNKIVIYPNKIINTTTDEGCGLPSPFFHDVGGGDFRMEATQKIGFDRHFNAWSTSAIVLCSGVPTVAYASGQDPSSPNNIFQFTPGEQTADLHNPANLKPVYPDQNTAVTLNNVESNLYNLYTYCGSDFPEFGFDGEYFFFKNLHTPLNLGNLELTQLTSASQLEASAKDVYKINPTQQYTNYTPTQFPYEQPHPYHLLGDADPSKNGRILTRTNTNLDKFALYDTTTGIFFEDFGYSEDTWDSGLWGRLGFTYEQFNSATNNRSERVTSKNTQDLKLVTTNCAIEAKDSKGWCVDQFNQPMFDGTISHPQNIYVEANPVATAGDYSRVCQFPRITEAATSLIISAQNYPLALEEGYFTIRSDIIPQSSFISGNGNTHLPIVGIVNKQSPQGDFYISQSSELTFTVTKPQILTAIKVAICDPDGDYAILNDRSSVIFKLTRDRQIDTKVAQDVFAKFGTKSSM